MFARPQLSTKPVSSWWESDDLVGKRSQRRAAEKSGYWHRWLLRLRRERPRRRAAEQRDELASSYVEHGLLPGTRCASLPQAQDAPEAPAGPWGRPELF